MSFQFRFAAISQLRCRERDEAGAEVGQAVEAIHRIQDQILEIENQRQSGRDRSLSARTGEVTVDDLLVEGRYDMQLEAQVQALNHTLSQLNDELLRRQQVLMAAEAEVKRFERLEANDRSRYDAEQNRREQFEADDATSRKYAMKLRESRQGSNS